MLGRNLRKLVGISKSSATSSVSKDELLRLSIPVSLTKEVGELLTALNGGYAFESALHIFGTGNDRPDWSIASWNQPTSWRDEYQTLNPAGTMFAEDVFGGQFVLCEGGVATFDPETGELEMMADSLEGWAEELLDDYDFYTGQSLAHDWQQLHGVLLDKQRLVPKIPFVFNGEFETANLAAVDALRSMKARADLALQLLNHRDGTKVKLHVAE
jgi:Protein of unknown function DUF2625